MNLFMYLSKDSLVHRIDPRAKVLILLSIFALSLLFKHPFWILGVAFIVLFYGLLAKSLGNIKRIWVILLTIFIMSTIMWSIFGQGKEQLFWIIEKEALLYGIATGIKVDTMIIAGLIFLSSTKIEEIALGLVKMGLPYKASFAFTSAIRLVPTFIGAGATITQAQRSRGLDLDKGNFVDKIKNYIPLLVPIFLSAIRSTDQLAMALESKGFGAQKERTFYGDIKFESKDYIVLAIFLVMLIIGFYLKFNGYGDIEGLLN